MNIHEYQAKELLREFGVPVPKGIAVFSVGEAEKAARELGGPVWVVKSQIHAGGRGKGRFKEKDAGDKGGVRLARSVEEVVADVEQMLGRTLVTHQTGPAGRTVSRLYIEEGSEIARELYLSCLVDRADGRIAFIASAGRWHEHRGSRRRDAGEDRHRPCRPGCRLHAPCRAADRLRRSGSAATQVERMRQADRRRSTAPSSRRT